MLRSELTRNWTRPNPTIRLTRSQKKELETRGKELNALAAKIGAYFRIVYVTADETPLSVRFHLPRSASIAASGRRSTAAHSRSADVRS